jgi:phosphoribosylaminoimidazolecarboxamide formyltransferase/IMP cyclohydrolase
MNDGLPVIRRALLSVSDKEGIAAFAKFLVSEFGVEILSTGGTAKELRDAGVEVVDVSDYTGFSECFDGRVKTLHPKIHGALLYRRGDADHERQAEKLGIKRIDLVAVNLYPFEQTVAKPNVTEAEAIENIDIGGPSMLRSAAKNFESVAVASDPTHYSWIQNHMVQHKGGTSLELRRLLAGSAFEHSSHYDARIAEYLRFRFPAQP